MSQTLYYSGYRPILRGRSDQDFVNTYTGKLGNYSNWDLFSTEHALDGAPLKNRVPGSGPYGEGDVQMSRWFLGLDVQYRKSSLRNPGNSVYNDYYGRYVASLFRGTQSTMVFSRNFGHVPGGGPQAAYALFSNYQYYGLPIEQALGTPTLGHPSRYPESQSAGVLGPDDSNPGASATFGSFQPLLYKGLSTRKSNPMNNVYHPGHPVWGPSVETDIMPQDYGEIPPPRAAPEHYGFEHVLEWRGVPSAKAL